jgi:hypothetical protein
MEKQNYFNEKELIERTNIKKIFDIHLKYMGFSDLILTEKESYSVIDFFLIFNNRMVACEYKKRDLNLNSYNDYIIEYYKWESLNKYVKIGCDALYINEFNDNKVAIWNIGKYQRNEPIIDYLFGDKDLNNNGYDKYKKSKSIRYLPVKDATILDV